MLGLAPVHFFGGEGGVIKACTSGSVPVWFLCMSEFVSLPA